MTGGAQPTLTLRKTAISHEERRREEFDELDDDLDRLRYILGYLDEAGAHAAEDPGILEHFATTLHEIAADADSELALGGLGALRELNAVAPEVVAMPEETPDLEGHASDLIFPLADRRLQQSALAYVRELRPDDWTAFYAEALPVCATDVCDTVAGALVETGHTGAVAEAVEKVMSFPLRFPEALIWLWRAVGSGNLPDGVELDRAKLLRHMLGGIDRASRIEDGGQLFGLFRSALTARNLSTFRSILLSSDLAEGRAAKEALGRCLGITDHLKEALRDALVDAHPKLFVKKIKEWNREDVIYTTSAGLAKKRADYEVLVNDRLPEIAKAIGAAAALGDLSENAEYTAALETRERLTERANAAQTEIEKAQPIPPEMPDIDSVTIGSRIRVRNIETGEERSLTFLGPWDVDTANGIFSYRAPISLPFMGHTVGQTVVVTTGIGESRYEILEVGSGLTD
jgi:transcription elongation factor GreA